MRKKCLKNEGNEEKKGTEKRKISKKKEWKNRYHEKEIKERKRKNPSEEKLNWRIWVSEKK